MCHTFSLSIVHFSLLPSHSFSLSLLRSSSLTLLHSLARCFSISLTHSSRSPPHTLCLSLSLPPLTPPVTHCLGLQSLSHSFSHPLVHFSLSLTLFLYPLACCFPVCHSCPALSLTPSRSHTRGLYHSLILLSSSDSSLFLSHPHCLSYSYRPSHSFSSSLVFSLTQHSFSLTHSRRSHSFSRSLARSLAASLCPSHAFYESLCHS